MNVQRGTSLWFLMLHTSDQCQPLDLLTFGLMKRETGKSEFDKLDNKQSNLIIKILGAWFKVTAPHLVVTAFISAGIVPFDDNGRIFVKIDRSAAHRVRHWTRGEKLLDAAQEKLKILQYKGFIQIYARSSRNLVILA